MKIRTEEYVSYKLSKFSIIFGASIAFIFLVAAIIAIVSLYTGWSLVHPAKSEISAFTSNIVPEYTEVSFKDISKSVKLNGWLFRVKGSDKTVILAHGYGSTRLQFHEKTLDIVKALMLKGYNVLAFDFRNSGKSEGNLTSIGLYEKDDLLGAVKFIKSQGSKHIAILGFSMGASTAILAAADSTDVEAVVADSPFSDLSQYLDEDLQVWSRLPAVPFNKTITLSVRLLTGITPEKVSPRSVIEKLSPRPILFIHSKGDMAIPVGNSRALYDIYLKAAVGKAELWETDCSAHVGSFLDFPDEYMSRVLKFLDNSLKKK